MLLGLIFALDLLWALLAGSTGTLAYALVDEPGHLATAAVVLLGLAVTRLQARFLIPALVASVAIDLDHLPHLLGFQALTGTLPRPYTHSLGLVALLVLAAALWPRRGGRLVALGLAAGVSTHLLRDLSTGPGVPLLWPLSDGIARLDYGFYALTLTGLGSIAFVSRRSSSLARAVVTAAVGAAVLVSALTVVASPAQAHTVSIGAYVPGADNDPGLAEGLREELGRQPAILISYKNWTQAPFVYSQLDDIWETGAVPMITWEPWDDSGQGISLESIAGGAYDGYLENAARAAAGWGKPLMVRFAHEMNGSWYPWGMQPGAFRAAWRHIGRVFAAAGAANVRWVWTPYVNIDGRVPFRRYYPGNRWVDWAGLDGINWGGSFRWRSPAGVFDRSYQELLSFTSKPLVFAEVGSGESGGSKARWLSVMLNRVIPRMPHVMAVSFWSVQDDRGDLRVDSSGKALNALRRALSARLYRSSRGHVESAPIRFARRHHGR
jgi:hypothetical protein